MALIFCFMDWVSASIKELLLILLGVTLALWLFWEGKKNPYLYVPSEEVIGEILSLRLSSLWLLVGLSHKRYHQGIWEESGDVGASQRIWEGWERGGNCPQLSHCYISEGMCSSLSSMALGEGICFYGHQDWNSISPISLSGRYVVDDNPIPSSPGWFP